MAEMTEAEKKAEQDRRETVGGALKRLPIPVPGSAGSLLTKVGKALADVTSKTGGGK